MDCVSIGEFPFRSRLVEEEEEAVFTFSAGGEPSKKDRSYVGMKEWRTFRRTDFPTLRWLYDDIVDKRFVTSFSFFLDGKNRDLHNKRGSFFDRGLRRGYWTFSRTCPSNERSFARPISAYSKEEEEEESVRELKVSESNSVRKRQTKEKKNLPWWLQKTDPSRSSTDRPRTYLTRTDTRRRNSSTHYIQRRDDVRKRLLPITCRIESKCRFNFGYF